MLLLFRSVLYTGGGIQFQPEYKRLYWRTERQFSKLGEKFLWLRSEFGTGHKFNVAVFLNIKIILIIKFKVGKRRVWLLIERSSLLVAVVIPRRVGEERGSGNTHG